QLTIGPRQLHGLQPELGTERKAMLHRVGPAGETREGPFCIARTKLGKPARGRTLGIRQRSAGRQGGERVVYVKSARPAQRYIWSRADILKHVTQHGAPAARTQFVR